MKSLFTVMFVTALSGVSLLAQQTGDTAPLVLPTVSEVVTSLLGTPVPADAPKQVIGVGAGVQQGVPFGKIGGGLSVKTGTYVIGETTFSQGHQNYRGGLKQYLFGTQSGSFSFLINAAAGVATGVETVGGSFGTGADMLFRIGQSNRYINVSAELSKDNVSRLFAGPFNRASLERVASGLMVSVSLVGKVK